VAFKLRVFASLAGYRPSWLRADIGAGLAVAAVGLPSAIAYPAIAGLPPQTGIYASIVPMVAYAFFGPSRKLIVGPDAAIMTVLAAAMTAAVASVPGGLGISPSSLAATLAAGAGIVYLLAWALRLGVIASFLSRPILVGFFTGISLSILIGQIRRITGVEVESGGLLRPVAELVAKSAMIHWPSVALAAAMFAVLQVGRAVRLPLPAPVLVLLLSIMLSAGLDLHGHGVAIVGEVPSSPPQFMLPRFDVLPLQTLVLGSAAIFVVSFGSGIITARSLGALSGETVEPNRELVGFGAANIAGGLFGALPVGASDSRTAVNIGAGGRSQVASVVAAATLLSTLMFLGPALRIIPIPVLGAILVSTAIGLIDIRALRRLWRLSRMEFAFAMIAMWGPIGLGVLTGVLIAAAATLIYILRRTMFPRDAMLGRVPGREGFYKLHHTAQARPVAGLAIFLAQGDLLFFNADYMLARLHATATELPRGTRWLVIDAGAMSQIDSSGADILLEFARECREHGPRLALAELHAEARKMLERGGVIECVGADMVFEVLDDAYRAFVADYRESRLTDWRGSRRGAGSRLPGTAISSQT